VEAAIGFGKAR